MLTYAVIAVTLMCASTCQAFTNATHEQLWPFGVNMPWKDVETVGADKGCCQPDKMEAQVSFLMGRVEEGKPKMFVGLFKFYHDVKLGVDFYDGTLRINGQALQVNSWYDYKKSMQYTIFKGVKNERCIKEKILSGPWTLKCIPAGTKKIGKTYYGNPKAPNKLDVTWYEFADDKGNSDYYHAYTSFANTPRPNVCIPVTYSQYGSNKGVPYTMESGFMDIVMDVKNSDVFKIPSICKKDSDHAIPAEFSNIGSILLR